ncbi:MAG: hypothetical protein QW420_06465 [Candidatus Caldarchaeum sp.]
MKPSYTVRLYRAGRKKDGLKLRVPTALQKRLRLRHGTRLTIIPERGGFRVVVRRSTRQNGRGDVSNPSSV